MHGSLMNQAECCIALLVLYCLGLTFHVGFSLAYWAIFDNLVTDICIVSNISNTRDSVSSGYPNTEKRVENMTCSRVFLTKCELFG